jgi:hypothetical protein
MVICSVMEAAAVAMVNASQLSVWASEAPLPMLQTPTKAVESCFQKRRAAGGAVADVCGACLVPADQKSTQEFELVGTVLP